MDNDDQRFASKQGLFGWKGLGKDKTSQTSIFTVSLIVNFVLLLYAVSALGKKTAASNFEIADGPYSLTFYAWSGITLLACLTSAYFVRFTEFSTRWSARFLACGLPALFILFLLFVRQ